MSESTPGYRDLLYGSYVSANKRYLYDHISERAYRRNARNVLRSLCGWLPGNKPDARVLDIGCGAGHLLDIFSLAGYQHLYGVDTSAEQVAIARERFPQVQQGDAFEYLADDSLPQFDVITAFDLLEHLTRDEAIRLLELVRERLAPGGTLILQMPNGDSPFAHAVFASDLTHETLYTAISLRHLLGALGFTELKFQEHGPVASSVFGTARWGMWKVARFLIKGLHYAETGAPSSGIYTRTFRCRATRPPPSEGER